MKTKEFYNLVMFLGGKRDSKNFTVTREQFFDYFRKLGYADRTITNHATPSRNGGLINRLLADGSIEVGGLKRWTVIDVSSLAENDKKEVGGRKKTFEGNPPSGFGWTRYARLDDGDESGIEWVMYIKPFGKLGHNIKVVAEGGRVEAKANYWLVAKYSKLVMTRPAELLKQHRYEIYDALCDELAEFSYSSDN